MGLLGRLFSAAKTDAAPTPDERLGKALAAHKSGDTAAALRLWVPRAEAGRVEAMARLGDLHHNAPGVERDVEAAAAGGARPPTSDMPRRRPCWARPI
jgi:TPR repeat protein